MRRREVVHVLNADKDVQEMDWLPGERVIMVESDGSVKELDLEGIIRGNQSVGE